VPQTLHAAEAGREARRESASDSRRSLACRGRAGCAQPRRRATRSRTTASKAKPYFSDLTPPRKTTRGEPRRQRYGQQTPWDGAGLPSAPATPTQLPARGQMLQPRLACVHVELHPQTLQPCQPEGTPTPSASTRGSKQRYLSHGEACRTGWLLLGPSRSSSSTPRYPALAPLITASLRLEETLKTIESDCQHQQPRTGAGICVFSPRRVLRRRRLPTPHPQPGRAAPSPAATSAGSAERRDPALARHAKAHHQRSRKIHLILLFLNLPLPAK